MHVPENPNDVWQKFRIKHFAVRIGVQRSLHRGWCLNHAWTSVAGATCDFRCLQIQTIPYHTIPYQTIPYHTERRRARGREGGGRTHIFPKQQVSARGLFLAFYRIRFLKQDLLSPEVPTLRFLEALWNRICSRELGRMFHQHTIPRYWKVASRPFLDWNQYAHNRILIFVFTNWASAALRLCWSIGWAAHRFSFSVAHITCLVVCHYFEGFALSPPWDNFNFAFVFVSFISFLML